MQARLVNTSREAIYVYERTCDHACMGILLRDVLHMGSATCVRAAIDSNSGELFALKHYREDTASESNVDKLRHEYTLLRDLQGPGIIRVFDLVPHANGLGLVMEHWGAGSLVQFLGKKTISLDKALSIGAKIARALGRVHRQGIIHRDVKPHNVLVNEELNDVRLIDFGIAVRHGTYVTEETTRGGLAGSLAYMAPEQTGRMNRSVDTRTDLYGLGATLYHLLTQELPFEGKDMGEVIHAHLARAPVAPHERAPDARIPALVSAIVLELMKKNPDDRYQTADGVAYDLEMAAQMWLETGDVGPFELRSHDWPNRVIKPSGLFGREMETSRIADAYARVASGATELLLIAGPSGVGKSALVQAFRNRVRSSGGNFAAGKFDELQRGTPHLGLSQAFRSIVRRRLADSEGRLAEWKDSLSDAAGINARILVDMIPELVHVLGETPPLVEVGPVEARNRFRHTVRCFVRSMATKEQPLVLFLDDLQWADTGSIALLEELLTGERIEHFLVLGTYRDNEVHEGHDLAVLCKTLAMNGHEVQTLHLEPLGMEPLTNMVADMLDQAAEGVFALALVTKAKTDGTPFFVEQFLRALHEHRLLERNADTGLWQYDIEQIERAQVTENVVSLLRQRFLDLGPSAQRVLCIAACIGSGADTPLVGIVADVGTLALHTAINELFMAELVVVSNETEELAFDFSHDRIREHAYNVLEPDERIRIHHAIAIAILERSKGTLGDEQLFAMLYHRLLSLDMLTTVEAKRTAAEYCLRGGLRAKEAAAYAQAAHFLQTGQRLLGADAWTDDFASSFTMHLALAEAEWLSGRIDVGDALFQKCKEHARNPLECARIAETWVTLATLSGRYARAIDEAITCLDNIGLRLPTRAEDIQPFLGATLQRIIPKLMTATYDELGSWKRCQDSDAELAGRLLTRLVLATVFGKPELFAPVGFAMVEHTLTHGVTRTAAASGGVGALIAVMGLQNLELASRLCHLGETNLHLAAGYTAFALHALNLAKQYISPTSAEFYDHWARAEEIARSEGDTSFAEYCVQVPYFGRVVTGRHPLRRPPPETGTADYNSRLARRVLTLTYDALTTGTLATAASATREWTKDAPQSAQARHKYFACAASVMLHMGDTRLAFEHALAGEPLWRATACLPDLILMVFTLCISAELHPELAAPERARVDAQRARLENWAKFTPPNFGHMVTLCNACKAWREGRLDEARQLFDAAILDAHENGFVNHEALGLRLFGEFDDARGHRPQARAHLREGAETYFHWGAPACAEAIRQRFPHLFAATSDANPPFSPSRFKISTFPPASSKQLASVVNSTISVDLPEELINRQLDIVAVLRATHALSGELVLDSLVGRILRLLVENAGAERAVLALVRGNELRIQAEYVVCPDQLLLDLDESVEGSSRLAGMLVRYVERSKEPLLFSQTATDGRFDEDPYWRAQRPASILAIPLAHRGRISGVIYLEHKHVADAFPRERIFLVSLLAAQAATAVENATLYAEVKRQADALQSANASLEHQVEERTSELRAAKNAADLANRAKTNFLSSMSHELRTPLNGILGYAQVLEQMAELPPKARDGVDIIKKSGNHLLSLINDVLDLAKIEAGRMTLTLTPIAVGSLVKSVESMCRIRAEQKGISLEILNHAAPSLTVLADEKRFKQVLLNFLSNAIKFTQVGRVQLDVNAAVNQGTANLSFRIRDTGPGIAPEHLRTIFEPFEQVGDQRAKSEGTGLGLAITKRIVSLLGGTIQVESTIGVGSTFTVTFDVPTTEKRSTTATNVVDNQDISGYTGKRLAVLVVDDNADNRALIRDLLSPLGFDVLEAGSGEVAIQIAVEKRPLLVLMDWMMPGMSGLDTTIRMRSMPELAETVIIASSASVSQDRAKQCLDAGCRDFLPKPVERGTLLGMLEQHLGLSWTKRASSPSGTVESALRPPDSLLVTVADLARRGRVREIVEEIDRLQKLEPQYASWFAGVRVLAQKFHLKELREMIAN
jgi:predicted ATPase/signal transduction histidine kinase/CheY-like chemotaxis protein